MSTKNFCKNLGLELNAWKDSLNDIVLRFETRPGYAKAGVRENIDDINILVQDLQDRISQLDETCSLEGFDDINTQRNLDLRSKLDVHDIDQAMATVSPGTFGG